VSSSALARAGSYALMSLTKSGSWPVVFGGTGDCAAIICPRRSSRISRSMLYASEIARRSATFSGV
jgi:hypothetical protein